MLKLKERAYFTPNDPEFMGADDSESIQNAVDKAVELGVKNGWMMFPLGIALSGKKSTPGGGSDLAQMLGKDETIARVKAAIAKLS